MNEIDPVSMQVRSNPAIWLQTCGTILNRAGELVTPRVNSFQQRVIDTYLWCRANQTPCRIIILKPRRKGSSTVSLALAYTHLRNYMAYGAILGDDLGTTAKLMEVWNRYCENDKFGGWGNSPSLSKRGFSHGSKVYEETANDPRAGMGGDIHFLLASEAAHYRSKGKTSGEYVMQSVMNSVPNLPQSCVIIESTPNGAQGVFYNTWQSAVDFEDFKKGKHGNGYIRVFAPWFEFEDSRSKIMDGEEKMIMESLDADSCYNGEVALVEKYNVSSDKIKWRRQVIDSPACGRDPKKFMQEYPSDSYTCFLQSGSGRFDPDGLDRIQEVVTMSKEPKYGILEQPEGVDVPTFIQTSRHEAWLRIWEMPKEGLRYIGANDFMTGEQSNGSRRETDCHATTIGRAAYTDKEQKTFNAAVVAAFMPNDRTKDLDIVAERIGLLSKFYGGCLMAPEVNNLHGIIELMRRHGAALWSRKKQGTGKTILVPGFQTNTSTKRQIIGELAAIIREQEIDISCPDILSELRNFITHPDGQEAASEGNHDDWVMSLAILVHVLPASRQYESANTLLIRRAKRFNYCKRPNGLIAEVV